MEKQDYVIKDLTLKKKDFLSFALATLVIGFGLGLIVEYVCRRVPEESNWILLTLGIIITTVGVIFVLMLSIGRVRKSIKIKGTFFLDKRSLRIRRIPQYPCSIDFNKSMEALFKDMPGIKDSWEDACKEYCNGKDTDESDKNSCEVMGLIRELIEYEALEQASVVIETFYDTADATKKIKAYGKKDFSEIFMSNRFLRSFSEEPKNRQNFKEKVSIKRVDDNGKEEEIYELAQDGRIYTNFEVMLPKHSEIKRSKDGGIVLDTPQFSVEILPFFKGFTSAVSKSFYQLYLGEKDDNSFGKIIHPYGFSLSVIVSYKLTAFFSPNKRLYSWIDSYLNALNRYFSYDVFLEKINWPSCLAMSLISRNIALEHGDSKEGGFSKPTSDVSDSKKESPENNQMVSPSDKNSPSIRGVLPEPKK